MFCNRCKNERVVACPKCRGSGKVYRELADALVGRPENCVRCEGKTEISCPECMMVKASAIAVTIGGPTRQCSKCAGAGWTKCRRCSDGQVGSGCLFFGRAKCPACEGSTRIACEICKGSGSEK